MTRGKFIKGISKRPSWEIADNEVTPQSVFSSRRKIIKSLGLGSIAASLPGYVQAGIFDLFGGEGQPDFVTSTLQFANNTQFQATDEKTPYSKVIRHNNFYEFGTGKQDPYVNAQGFKVNPWQLNISGLVDKPLQLDYQALFSKLPLEQRTYRFRCVEAWSMVIPWIGFPLASLLKLAGVQPSAKYVAFETLFDPEQMPGQRNRLMGGGIHYPYVEGLRLDEAMNDLAFVAVGLYDQTLTPQSGAPVRIVLPWKYGFKSIKSIVNIRLLDKQPPTSWNQLAPNEYGFFANVNPQVDHPRWSQASERRIGPGGMLAAERIDTQLFNGYAEQVANLYTGMDLRTYF
ncbi:protein-methionine-sulfoxide reductase catalytic subunit MsrP [Shewanella avicenniae]|uniref:Protein-methionine-sulfoxide reductase catalytic subunit MsrP n=1 Tax=Shewanella avicenniae TaxID=2814294 RepID=A0ABX7QUZ3_9GAMM|nr:protein-methionine-sulfoxide reductase catalytic subunit MsrP [Shewanella avicenniae]QSX35309.1 protein-methionine-sulfoxide reductase catalytic subunit MsrP [Shewanella avicenniae]